jgi:4-diphosphocytidyl-2C-methyl-D-erythritol kinase
MSFQIGAIHYLHKKYSLGAGLGGGSAGCNSRFANVNQLYRLNLSNESSCITTGSDWSVFLYITNLRLQLVVEKTFTPIVNDGLNYHLVIINPGIHVNTEKVAFKALVSC